MKDTSIIQVGKPGSAERLAAYAEFYANQEANGGDESPFTVDLAEGIANMLTVPGNCVPEDVEEYCSYLETVED